MGSAGWLGEVSASAAVWYESVPTNRSARLKLFCMKRRKADSLLRRFEQRLKQLPETMGEYDREGLAANTILAQEKRKVKSKARAKAGSPGGKRTKRF
jgi:hypothetical protein